MNLQEFLNNNIVEGATTEVAISERLKDENGNLYKFKIKALSMPEIDSLRKRFSSTDKRGNSNLDICKYNANICIIGTIYPSFKDAESIEKTKSVTAENYLYKVLKAGEITKLADKIFEFSGYRQDINELVEEAKN